MPTFGNGNYTAFAAAWIRRCFSTQTVSAVGPVCSGSVGPRRCAAPARCWPSAVRTPWTSVSHTEFGAACRRPSANCCSSATSTERAASAAAPSCSRDGSARLQNRPVLLVLLDLVPLDTGVQHDLFGVLTVLGGTGRHDMVPVELHRVGRQDVRLAVHRFHLGDVAVGYDGGIFVQLTGLLQDGPSAREWLEDLAPLVDRLRGELLVHDVDELAAVLET